MAKGGESTRLLLLLGGELVKVVLRSTHLLVQRTDSLLGAGNLVLQRLGILAAKVAAVPHISGCRHGLLHHQALELLGSVQRRQHFREGLQDLSLQDALGPGTLDLADRVLQPPEPLLGLAGAGIRGDDVAVRRCGTCGCLLRGPLQLPLLPNADLAPRRRLAEASARGAERGFEAGEVLFHGVAQILATQGRQMHWNSKARPLLRMLAVLLPAGRHLLRLLRIDDVLQRALQGG
mmetsp:Transcript_58168/g.147675  ORF Transcript_58168/g.147675 Transcript_58168/m.147675 type:complete len:235 (+) Transcript_58168:891-1595(+)